MAVGHERAVPEEAKRRGTNLSFVSLVLTNVSAKKVRLALTAIAIAIGVMTVVSLGVLTESLRTSDLAIMKLGQASFTVSQKGVADIFSSNINQAELQQISKVRGVAAATGVLLATTKLNANNPLFLQIGVQPSDEAAFGVNVLGGRSFTATAQDEIMLGWRAAQDLHLGVGDRLYIDDAWYHIVGLYSVGQAQGDTGAMFPLLQLQVIERQPQQVTLVFIRAAEGVAIPALQASIDRQFPQLVTVRTVEQFGRADRSLSLIEAAADGSTMLAIVIGAVVVMSAMSMTFVERIREFGVLSAVGWSRARIWSLIFSEAIVMGILGAAIGSGLSVAAIAALQHLSSLRGVLTPQFTAGSFAAALYTAGGMSLFGGVYPAWRAAHITPMEALRHE